MKHFTVFNLSKSFFSEFVKEYVEIFRISTNKPKTPQIFQIIRLKHKKYNSLKNTATVDGQVRSIGLQSKEKNRKS